jgi:hypothetical protein
MLEHERRVGPVQPSCWRTRHPTCRLVGSARGRVDSMIGDVDPLGGEAAASRVVSGTAAIRPTDPQRVRTTSTAAASEVTTLVKKSPPVVNNLRPRHPPGRHGRLMGQSHNRKVSATRAVHADPSFVAAHAWVQCCPQRITGRA